MVVGSYGGVERSVGRDGLDALAHAAAAALGVPMVLISTFAADRQELVGAAGLGAGQPRVLHDAAVSPLCRHVHAHDRPAIVHDARRRIAAGDRALAELGVVGYAGVPIRRGALVDGVVAAVDHQVRAWTARDIRILRDHAEVAAALLASDDERRMRATADRALGQERALASLLLLAAGDATVDAVLVALARHAGAAFADVVAIDVPGRVRVRAWHAAELRFQPLVRDGSWPIDTDRFVQGAILATGPQWLDDLAGRSDVAMAEHAAAAGLRSAVALAVPGRASVVELLFVERTQARDEIERALTGVAALLGHALARSLVPPGAERRTAELEVIALHDDLTGLLNRRGFFALGSSQLSTARRKRLAGVLLYVDLDGLKGVNDDLGHASGDELLRDAAGVLRRIFGDADAIARIGGDEFVVLVTDPVTPDLGAIGARLGAELHRLNRTRAPLPPVRWSLGAVGFEPGSAPGLDALLSEADARMYASKRRQQVPS